jgi:hypothetical protein
MTAKAAFTDEEWDLLREAPATAGLLVITAEGGGTFRETFAIAKAYTDARKHHGESELLDELVAAGPKSGGRAHSTEELHDRGLQSVREAAALIRTKATPEDVEAYRAFVLTLAEHVAEAHKEGGQQVSDHERAALGEIESSLTTSTE